MAISDLPFASPYGFVSVWVKGTSFFPANGSGLSTILCCYDNNTGIAGSERSLLYQLVQDTGKTVSLLVDFGSFSPTYKSDPILLLDGLWHNLMVAWDFSGAALVMNFYVDNLPLNTFNGLGLLAPIGVRYGGRSWMIGNIPQFNALGDPAMDQGFYGSMAALFVLMDQPIDITDEAVRFKFIQNPAAIA